MRFFARLTAVAMVAVLALTVTGCKRDVAVKVNGEVIKKSEVDAQIAQIRKQYPQMFRGADAKAREEDFRNRVVENLINAMVIRQAAEKMDIEISEKTLDRQMAELKKGFADQKAFQDALKKYGMDEAKLREQLRQQARVDALSDKLMKNIRITDAEIRKYYDDRKADFIEPKGVRTSHILFAENDKATAQRVLGRIRDGADFTSLAKQYSIDKASASKGGDLGFPQTPLVPAYQATADKLAVGQVSDLVKTPYGWHIIKVVAKRAERRKSYAEVKDQIKQILQQQRQAEIYQDFLNKEKKKAQIAYTKGFGANSGR